MCAYSILYIKCRYADADTQYILEKNGCSWKEKLLRHEHMTVQNNCYIFQNHLRSIQLVLLLLVVMVAVLPPTTYIVHRLQYDCIDAVDTIGDDDIQCEKKMWDGSGMAWICVRVCLSVLGF